MSRLTRDGTAEPVSRDQILRHARGQGNVHFPCSADHEQDWQPYPVDPYSAICDDHTYIHTFSYRYAQDTLPQPFGEDDTRRPFFFYAPRIETSPSQENTHALPPYSHHLNIHTYLPHALPPSLTHKGEDDTYSDFNHKCLR